jgi:site-specific DNA-methyltransferase (adenine-specific)
MTKPYKITQLDALEYLQTLPDESVDLIVTDPPYESLEKWRKVGTTTRLKHSKGSSNDWFHVFPNDRLEAMLTEFQRVMKKNSHLYIHCDETTRDVMRPMFDRVGLKFWKSLVWGKVSIGMGYHWRATYEFILFAEKGKRNLNNKGLPDIFTIKRLKGPQYYPTQKPLELVRMLVENSSKPGDIVMDPFMGAGTVGVAALKTGRIFWGSDIDEKAVQRARERLVKERDRQRAKAIETAAVEPQNGTTTDEVVAAAEPYSKIQH